MESRHLPWLEVLQSRGVDSAKALGSHPLAGLFLQSLSNKPSLAEAENMADLVDGYCRLQGSTRALHHSNQKVCFHSKVTWPKRQWVAHPSQASGRSRESQTIDGYE